MRGKLKSAFYKQITSNLIAIFLTSLVLIGIVISLFLYQREQLQTSIDYHIPNLEKLYFQQQYFVKNDQLLEKMLSSEALAELSVLYRQYHQSLQAVSKQSSNQRSNIKKLLVSNRELSKVIEKIENNETRNNQLKQNTIIQLQLIINSLTNVTAEISNQQEQLQQQIITDNVKDKVTVSRAKAYISTLNLLNQYDQLLTVLSVSLRDIKLLTIQVSLSQFTEMNLNLEQAIQLWTTLSEHQQSIKNLTIQAEIEQLNHLLFTEQRTMAKWYSHIRLAESIFSALQEQKHELRLIADNSYPHEQIVIHMIPNVITALADRVSMKITLTSYYLFLLVCLSLGIVLLIMQLLLLRRRIKRHSATSIDLLKAIVAPDFTGVSDNDKLMNSAESTKIYEIVSQLIKPEHSEQQYQRLLTENKQNLTIIAQKNAVVNWHYIPQKTYIKNNELLMSLLSKNGALPEGGWRCYFDKPTVELLILTAKEVKENAVNQSCIVTTISGQHLNIYINKSEQGWFGTVADISEINNLEHNIQKLKDNAVDMTELLDSKDIAYADKLSNMIVRTMLQSQSVSVNSSVNSLQVYRQLTRIFDWCRQTKIKTQLQQNNHSVSATDINLHNEVHAAVFNMMSEANLQRNQIFLRLDTQLNSQVNIDIRLFHRTLLGVCRLILAEQFKSTLQLNVKVIDKKAGQQIVRFEFIAFLNKAIKKIPDNVSLLVAENELLPVNVPEVVCYLHALLTSLHGENRQVQQSDEGFKLIFDLPITIVTSQHEEQVAIDLKQANVLVVSGNQISNSLVKNCLSTTTAKVEVLTESRYFNKQVTTKHLNRQKLDVVILADDCFKSDIGHITQQIASLPKSLRPKLMVMQSAFSARMHLDGLFSQSNNPLCCLSFLQALQNLLLSDKADNCLLKAAELNQHQYLPTQVEVLFAVEDPEKHQILIRVLQWLGLHIHIVCHSQSLIKHWQSGRYLLLFTELTVSPFIELDTGKSIRRGIFKLTGSPIESAKDTLETATKNWINVSLSAELDIQTLVVELLPWLKSKASALAPENVKTVQHGIETEDSAKITPKKYIVEEGNIPTIEVKDELLNQEPPVFNMLKYAQNQGSSELAAYMLDEYIADINIAFEKLIQAVKDNEQSVIHAAINTLLMTASILSANEFHLCCQKLQQAIIDRDTKRISSLISKLEQQQLLLVNFAEAI